MLAVFFAYILKQHSIFTIIFKNQETVYNILLTHLFHNNLRKPFECYLHVINLVIPTMPSCDIYISCGFGNVDIILWINFSNILWKNIVKKYIIGYTLNFLKRYSTLGIVYVLNLTTKNSLNFHYQQIFFILPIPCKR